MRAGRLRHWLTFQRKVTDLDSDGATVETWVDAFELNSRMPCNVEYLSGRELIAAQMVNSRVSCRLSTRYRPGFDATLRATQPDGTIYNLEALVPDSRSGRREVTFLASTGVNEG
jgi:head-tail adaptor